MLNFVFQQVRHRPAEEKHYSNLCFANAEAISNGFGGHITHLKIWTQKDVIQNLLDRPDFHFLMKGYQFVRLLFEYTRNILQRQGTKYCL